MKEAVERIRSVGKSLPLCELVERIKEDEEKFKRTQGPVNGEQSYVLSQMNHFAVPGIKWEKATIRERTKWLKMDACVEVIVIMPNCCNEVEVKDLDLGLFLNVREVRVGDNSFENVDEVKVIGLHSLKRVAIGRNCFTKVKGETHFNPNRSFCLKDCPKFRVLTIGCKSFSDFSVCEISNLASLEGIEMGEVKEESFNFQYAEKLELKSMTSKGK